MHGAIIKPSSGWFVAILIGCGGLLLGRDARAHCDTEKGPVIEESRAALEKGDAGPVLKWVRPEREAEIREALRLALEVRGKGGDACRLADRWFVETVVRIHRAGEGASYTGIRRDEPAPVVVLADKALAEGNADPVIAEFGKALDAGIRTRHARVMEAAKHKDCCVEGGRAYVAAYVDYVHFVERVQALLARTTPSHKQEADGHAEPPVSGGSAEPGEDHDSHHR